MSWLSSPAEYHWTGLPQQASGSADGRSHRTTADATRSNSGNGHAKGKGKGELEPWTPKQPKITPGASGNDRRGFDKATSKENPAKRTQKSRTFANTDGSTSVEYFTGPEYYKASDGTMQPIDPTLTPDAGGRLAKKADSQTLSFASSGDDPALMTFGQDADSVSFGLSGAVKVKPAVSGASAAYAGILPNVDMRLTATKAGVKEDLILQSAAAQAVYTYDFTTTGGLTAKADAEGVSFVDAKGVARVRVPNGIMIDSKLDPRSGQGSQSNNVTFSLVDDNGQPALRMTLDAAWLADPARVFPVTVDPTTSAPFQANDSAVMDTTNSPMGTYSGDLKTGSYDGVHNAASFVQYTGIANYANTKITAATLNLWQTYSSYCGAAEGIYLYQITGNWNVGSISSYPGVPYNSTGLGSLSTIGGANCNGSQWDYIPLSSNGLAVLQSWAQGASNYGFLIEGNTGTNTDWKRYNSVSEGGVTEPSLTVTYSQDVPPQVDSVYPGNNGVETSLTPELLATGHDSDLFPNAVQYDFQVYNSAGTKVADSGLIGSGDWTVPASANLAWGQSYSWQVETYDGYLTSGWTGAQFTVVVPQPPITSALSQNAGGHSFDPSIGNYTTEATDVDVASVGPSLQITRDYNSMDPRSTGAFGAAWSSVLDAKASEQYTASGAISSVNVAYPNGSEIGFGQNGNGTFSPPQGRFATFTRVTGGYTLTDKNDTVYAFTQSLGGGAYGITAITDANKRVLTLGWSGSQIATMTSGTSGRAVHLTWATPTGASSAHVSAVTTDPTTAGQPGTALTWIYGYNGDQLASVCSPADVAPNCTRYGYSTGSAFPATVLNTAPHSYWRLGELAGATAASSVLINEGTDNLTYVRTNPGQPGPLTGGTATSTGLTGSNSSYLYSQGQNLAAAGSFVSVGTWFKTTTAGAVIFYYGDTPLSDPNVIADTHVNTPALYVGTDSKLHGCFSTGNCTTSGQLLTSGATVTDGTWHYALLSGAGTSQTLYLDGVAQGTSNGRIQIWNQPYLGIGAGVATGGWQYLNTGTTNNFTGSLSDAAVWTQPLSSAQVASVYQAGHRGTNLLTGVTRPSGKTLASVSYNTAAGTVSSVTDNNGGSWTVGSPLVTGSSQVFRSAVLSASPAGYWRLADKAGSTYAYDEVAADGTTSSYNNVTLGQGSAFGDVGAAGLNGSSSYLRLPDNAFVTSSGSPASIGLWFTTSAGGAQMLLATGHDLPGTGSPGSGAMPVLYVGTDGKLHGHFWNGGTAGLSSSGAVNDGKWHHAVLTTNGSSQMLYLDGSPVTGTPLAGTTQNLDPYDFVGAGVFNTLGWPGGPSVSAPAWSYFNGTVGEVEFFRAQLSGAQAAQQFQAYRNSSGVMPATTVKVLDPQSAQTRIAFDGTSYAASSAQTWTGAGARLTFQTDGNLVVYRTDTGAAIWATGTWGNPSAVLAFQTDGNLVVYSDATKTRTLWTSNTGTGSGSYALFQADGSLLIDRSSDNRTLWSYLSPVTTAADVDSYIYDATNGNRTLSETDAGGGVTGYGYDTSGYQNTITNPDGDTTTIGHDVRGNTVSKTTCQVQYSNTCSTEYWTYWPDDVTAQLTPDARNDLPTSFRDGRSASASDPAYATAYTYDQAGDRVAEATPPVAGFPNGRTTTINYTDGVTIAATDSGYAPAGLVFSTVTPGGGTAAVSYQRNGDVASTTSPDGLIIRYTYDNLGRVLSKTEVSDSYPNGLATSYTYNGEGAVAQQNDPAFTDRVTGAVHTPQTTTNYDTDGNILSQTVVDLTGGDASRTESSTYNQYDQLASSTAAANQTSQFWYNAFGDKVKDIDPRGVETDSTFDAEGHVLTQVLVGYTGDPANPTSAHNLTESSRMYDPAGRLASLTDSLGNTTSYLYTDNGLLAKVTRTDSRGQNPFVVQQNTYDAADHLISQATNNGATVATSNLDAASRVTSQTLDPSGVNRTTSYTYTPDDAVAGEQIRDNASGWNRSVTSTYNTAGRMLSQTVHAASTSTAPASAAGQTGSWALADAPGTTAADTSSQVAMSAPVQIAFNGQTFAAAAVQAWTTAAARLVFQADGNLVEYRTSDGAAIWASNTQGNTNATLAFRTDGNLVIYSAPTGGTTLWASGTTDNTGAIAQLTTNGEFDIVSSTGAKLWDANTAQPGYSNPGTLTGGASWSTDHGGSALFDGATGAITTTHSSVDTTKSFSVSAWVKLNTFGAWSTAVSQDAGQDSGFYLQYDNADNRWALSEVASDNNPTSAVRALSSAPPLLNTWTHLVGTYDSGSGTLALYVNGVAQGTATNAHNIAATGPLAIGRGRWSATGSDYFHGQISGVKMYNRLLSGAEAANIYGGVAAQQPQAGLAGQWNLIDGNVATAADASGNNHPLALSGSASWSSGHAGSLNLGSGLPWTGALTFSGVGGCLDDLYGSLANAAVVDIWNCNGSMPQTWTLNSNGTLTNGGVCLDIYSPSGPGTANGTKVQLYACNGQVQQQWQLQQLADGTWHLVNPNSGRCLDDPGLALSTGAQVQIWDCNGGSNQRITGFTGLPGAASTATPIVDTSKSFSLSAWAKAVDTSSAVSSVAAQNGGQQALTLLYADNGSTKNWNFALGRADSGWTFDWVTSGVPVVIGQWTHLVGVFDASSGTMSLYVNGVLKATGTHTARVASSGNFEVGKAKGNGVEGNAFKGSVSGVQTFSTALTATQVSTLYGGGSVLPQDTTVTTQWGYDQRGLPVSETDGNGNTTTFANDEAGHRVMTSAPAVPVETGGGSPVTAHPVTTVGYDSFGDVVENQDANGNTTTTAYDADGRALSATLPSYTAPGATTAITATTSRSYDADGNVLTSTDPLGNKTSFAYDQMSDLATATDANNGVTHYTYDTNGEKLSVTDASGAQTQATYDYMGRRLTSTVLERYPTAASFTTTSGYDPSTGFPTQETSPAGVVSKYGYDNIGELTSTTDGANNKTAYAYDFMGNRQRTTSPDGTVSEIDYDALSRPVVKKAMNSLGVILSQANQVYDGTDNVLSSTDARGTTTTFGYDATGAVTSENQPVVTGATPSSVSTSFGYDAAGNRTRYTDGNGKAWITKYNAWNLPESQIEPTTATYTAASDSTFTTAYDADGRPVSQTAPGGVNTSAGYDALGRLTGQSGSGAEAATASRTFGYDSVGRMTSAATAAAGTAAATSEAFTYNDRGAPLTATGSGGSSSFGYSSDGQMASRTDAAGTSTYGYDTAGRLSTVADAATGSTLTYGYNTLNQVKSIGYGSGADARSFGYDSLHRLTSDTLATAAGATVASVAYGYDADGNLTSKNTTGFGTAVNNTYAYDLANRLTSWNNGTTTTAYSYDANGNRTQVGSNVFTYDARDQLTSDGVTSYSYTARGTLRSQTSTSGTVNASFDAYGQGVTQGNATYTYDALGRSVADTVAGGQNWTFSFSGTANDAASDGTNTYSRGPAGDLIGVNAVGAPQSSGQLAFTDLHTDVVGNFTATGTSLAGTAVYDPLGTTIGTATTRGHLGYQQGWTESSNGRVNMGSRWYNPATGQFTSRDTMNVSPVPNAAAANPFAYIGDNPMVGTDPSGHCSWYDVVCGASSAVSATASAASSAWNATTSAVSTAWDATSSAVSGAWDAATSWVSDAADEAWDDSRALMHKAASYAKAAVEITYHATVAVVVHGYQSTTHFVADGYHRAVRTAKHYTRAAVNRTKRVYHAAAKVVKTAYHAAAHGAKAAATFVKHHAAAIASMAVSVVVFAGCEAAAGFVTGGVGAVAGAAACGALAGAAGSLVDQGSKCIGGKKGACSVGAFAKSAALGGIGGAVGGALGGAIGGKIANAIGGKIAGGVLGKALPKAIGGAAEGSVFGGITGGTTGAAAYGMDCGSRCSLSGLGSATASGAASGAVGGAIGGALGGLLPTRCGGPHSFTAQTAVLMADGTAKPISQIKVGDQIADTVPGQNGTQAHTVTNVIVTTTDRDFVDVGIKPTAVDGTGATAATAATGSTGGSKPRLLAKAGAVLAGSFLAVAGTTATAQAADTGTRPAAGTAAAIVDHGGTLTTTFHHPFYDETQTAFVDAADLRLGDVLQTPAGTAEVTSLRLYHQDAVTYDLTIGDLHTYYVVAGETPVLVHNCGEGDPLPQHGPFHRLASPTQTTADTQKIIDSGELWGGPGRFSDTPMVQAHAGPLPEGAQGFEFYTDVAPNTNDVPWRANWSSTKPGVMMRQNDDYAAIPIVITRVNHGEIQWERAQ